MLRQCPEPFSRDDPLIASRPRLARGVAALVARAGDEFSEWNGDVGPHPQARGWRQAALGDGARERGRAARRATCFATSSESESMTTSPRSMSSKRAIVARSSTGSSKSSARSISRSRGPQSSSGSSRGAAPWTIAARTGRRRVTDAVLNEFEGLGSAPYPILWTVERKRILRDVMPPSTRIPQARSCSRSSITSATSRRGSRRSRSPSPTDGRSTSADRSTVSIGACRASGDRLQDRGRPSSEERRSGIATGTVAAAAALLASLRSDVDPDAPVVPRSTGTSRRRAAGGASTSRSTTRFATASSRRSTHHEWHRRRRLPGEPR